jgi:uncharacterized membrane protein (UPF0127 family)
MSAANNSQKRKAIWLCVAFAGLILIVIAWYAYEIPSESTQSVVVTTSGTSTTSTLTGTVASATSTSPYPYASLGEQHGIVTIDGQTIYVDLAENAAQQELGLGNRASLGAHQGMLFLFTTDDVHEFWMKDMSFSIDMVWLSADGTIIYIQPNVAPSTYPDAFGPNELSRYVLELPANFASTHGIKVGDVATLP